VSDLALPITSELLDALADELEQRLQERRRWAKIGQTAEHTELTVKQVRGLRARHPEIATWVGNGYVFDLRKVDEVLEQRQGQAA
jgi:hypothetical protein